MRSIIDFKPVTTLVSQSLITFPEFRLLRIEDIEGWTSKDWNPFTYFDIETGLKTVQNWKIFPLSEIEILVYNLGI